MQPPQAFPETLLVVDDEEDFVAIIAAVLERAGYETFRATSLAAAAAQLKDQFIDLMLIDERLGRDSGTRFLEELPERHPGLSAVVISAHADFSLAKRAMQAGAADILSKPVSEDELLGTIRRVLNQTELMREGGRNRWIAQRTARPPEIVGNSKAIREVLDTVGRVASTNSAVLIQGETGTGKELIARAIHLASPRNHKKMFSMNMGGLDKELVGAKLFGSVRGSYTGSIADRKGMFEEAHGSTLFLDEIGEMPLEVQPQLLRALAEHTIVRVGENVERKVNVRLVTATHRNLSKEVNAGRFRQDLYFRLNVVLILLPALRERPEDIEPLANHLLRGFVRKQGSPVRGFQADAMRALRQYAWPGNVRELANVVENAVTLARGAMLTAADLRLETNGSAGTEWNEVLEQPFEAASLGFERVYFQRLLQRALNKKTKAAELSGLHRSTVDNYLKKLGLNED